MKMLLILWTVIIFLHQGNIELRWDINGISSQIIISDEERLVSGEGDLEAMYKRITPSRKTITESIKRQAKFLEETKVCEDSINLLQTETVKRRISLCDFFYF